MIRFLTIADIHLSDQNPSSRVDDYPSAIQDKLRQVGLVCKKLSIDFVLCSGDWFHNKAASKTSHETVAWLVKETRSWGCPVVSIVGSHDFPWSNLGRVRKQPIGVLASSGAVVLLDSRGDSEEDLFVPDWVFRKEGKMIRVTGLNDDGRIHLRDFIDLSTLKKGEEDFLVTLVHTFASMEGGSFFQNSVLSYQDLAKYGESDVYVFGHWHQDQGVQSVGDRHFVNVGAVSRGAYNDDNINRSPKICLCQIDSGGLSFKPIKLKVRPKEEIFDVEKKEALREKEVQMGQFISELSVAVDDTSSAFDGEALVSELDIDAKVKNRVKAYLEGARDD